MLNMRTRHGIVAVFLGAFVLLLLASPSQGQTPDRIRIGWNYHMGNAPVLVADQKGVFRKHGVAAEVQAFASGPSLSQALLAKQVDMAYVGFLPAFHGLDRGLDVTAVAQSSYGLGSILVRKDSGISTLQDLKGKKLAGSRKNSGNDVIFRGFLLRELARLDPDRDVQIVPMAVDAMGPVVLNRTVDGAMTLEPFTTQYLLGEETKVLVNTVDAAPKHPWYLVWVRTEFLHQHRDLVVKAVRAHVEAVKFLNENLAEASDLIARAFKLSAVNSGAAGKTIPPAEVARHARERVGYDYALTEKEIEFFERQVGWSRSLGIARSPKKAAELVDLGVMKEALGGK